MGKGDGTDIKLVNIFFLNARRMGLIGLEAPYPQFLPTRPNNLSVVSKCLNALSNHVRNVVIRKIEVMAYTGVSSFCWVLI